MFSNNLRIIVGCIFLVLICSFGKIEGCSGGGNDNHDNGCPTVDEVPVMDSKYDVFVCFAIWDGWGDSTMVGGCNGEREYGYDGKKWKGQGNKMWPVGSILVKNGCTFYGYEEMNYKGDLIKYKGPNVYPNGCADGKCPKIEAADDAHANGFRSLECYCDQEPIICDPKDFWVSVMEYDNRNSSSSTIVTFSKTIGTTWTTEAKESFSVGDKIEATLKEGFFLNMGELKVSETTGYDWSAVSTEVKSDSVTTQVDEVVPAHSKLNIQFARGICANNIVNTETYRIIKTDATGSIISETFEPQIYGKVISGKESYDFELQNDEMSLENIRDK